LVELQLQSELLLGYLEDRRLGYEQQHVLRRRMMDGAVVSELALESVLMDEETESGAERVVV